MPRRGASKGRADSVDPITLARPVPARHEETTPGSPSGADTTPATWPARRQSLRRSETISCHLRLRGSHRRLRAPRDDQRRPLWIQARAACRLSPPLRFGSSSRRAERASGSSTGSSVTAPPNAWSRSRRLRNPGDTFRVGEIPTSSDRPRNDRRSSTRLTAEILSNCSCESRRPRIAVCPTVDSSRMGRCRRAALQSPGRSHQLADRMSSHRFPHVLAPAQAGSTSAIAGRSCRSQTIAAAVPPKSIPSRPTDRAPLSSATPGPPPRSPPAGPRGRSRRSRRSRSTSGRIRSTGNPAAARARRMASSRRRFPCSGPIDGQITHPVDRCSPSGREESERGPGPSRRCELLEDPGPHVLVAASCANR